MDFGPLWALGGLSSYLFGQKPNYFCVFFFLPFLPKAYMFLLFLFSFFLLLFLRLLLFTQFGESPVRENLFPPIFWHNQKIYAKKKLGKFYSFTKKKKLIFFYFLWQAFGHGAWTNPSPWFALFSYKYRNIHSFESFLNSDSPPV